jgi:hypothetical protein
MPSAETLGGADGRKGKLATWVFNAGAHERCAACLGWIDRRQTGAVAVYMPYDLRPPLAYVICKRCARAINGTPEQQTELTRKVETYLDGSAK